LTNEVHTFPADSSGVVASTALAAGLFEVRVFKGTTRYVNSGNQGIPRRYAATVSATGITGNFATTSGGEARYTPTGVNSDSGAVVVTINVFDTASSVASITLIKTYTFSKSKAGTDGSPGAPGPGVVFRGAWASGQTYIASATRRDVVIFNTTYYYATTTHTSTSGNSPTSSNNPWSQFGAQFESVATDILLAQDATITRGLVMGSTDAPNSGFIRSANATAFDAGIGYYLRGGGDVRFGDPSGSYLEFSGSTLTIKGAIRQTSGGSTIVDYVPRGTWVSGTTYAVNNLVQYVESNGTTSTYACVTAHESDINSPPPGNNQWTLYASGGVGTAGSSAKALSLTSTAQAFKLLQVEMQLHLKLSSLHLFKI